jgi:hypothetical protein
MKSRVGIATVAITLSLTFAARGVAGSGGRSTAIAHSHARSGGTRTAYEEHRHRRPDRVPCRPLPPSCRGPLRSQILATSRPGFSILPVRTALNNSGRVAFAAQDANGVDYLALADGGPVASFDMSAWGLANPKTIGIDDPSDVAFVATASGGNTLGVFATDASGAVPRVIYAPTTGGGLGDNGLIQGNRAFALAPNGTLAFSSANEASNGAFYRGPVTGAMTALVPATGIFSNCTELDVNSAGVLAAETEGGGECGLKSNIFLYDTPAPTLATLTSAIAGLADSDQPTVAINDQGSVAFAIGIVSTPPASATDTVNRCPSGQPPLQLDLPTGVYVGTGAPLSVPLPDLTLIAQVGADYADFGEVDINNAGTVVFDATLANGNRGVFDGPDPVANKIVAAGDTLGGEVVTDVVLGHLNDACELSLTTVSASGLRVWRVSGLNR